MQSYSKCSISLVSSLNLHPICWWKDFSLNIYCITCYGATHILQLFLN
jgi:hypothetical protein